jgi:thiol-disulfide isomerase/thioredoxin
MKTLLLLITIAVGVYYYWDKAETEFFAVDRPVSSYSSKKWFDGSRKFNQSVSASKDNNAGHLIYFYTDWCPFCRRLAGDILYTKITREGLSDVVKISLNPETTKEARRISTEFGVTGYPTVLIKYPDMEQYKRVKIDFKDRGIYVTTPNTGGRSRSEPYSPESFVRAVQNMGL